MCWRSALRGCSGNIFFCSSRTNVMQPAFGYEQVPPLKGPAGSEITSATIPAPIFISSTRSESARSVCPSRTRLRNSSGSHVRSWERLDLLHLGLQHRGRRLAFQGFSTQVWDVARLRHTLESAVERAPLFASGSMWVWA